MVTIKDTNTGKRFLKKIINAEHSNAFLPYFCRKIDFFFIKRICLIWNRFPWFDFVTSFYPGFIFSLHN